MAGVHKKRQHSSDEEPTQERAHPLLFQRPNELSVEPSVQPGPSGLQDVTAISHPRPFILQLPLRKRWQKSYVDLKGSVEQQMKTECMTRLNTDRPKLRMRPVTPRPTKGNSNFNYKPERIFQGEITATVSVYPYDTSIYSPSVLAFNNTSTALEFKISATTTLYLMEKAQQSRFPRRAAILGLYLVRHSVCILDNSLPEQKIDNAVKSFPNDVLGKWCFPDGETVIMVNFYANPNCANAALNNLIDAMKAIDKLGGEYTSMLVCLKRKATLENHQACSIKAENNFKVITPEPLSLVFKPVFTQKFYFMESVKNRMAAEVLQAAILVFIHMLEKILTSDNIGGALYVAQCMHGCSQLLYFLIPDEDLTNYYLFTMSNWYLGRCYLRTYRGFPNGKKPMIDEHTDAQEKLGEFHVRFFGKLLTAYNKHLPAWCLPLYQAKSFYFPSTITQVFKRASALFNAIQAPRRWHRSCALDLYARSIHNHLQLIKFEKSVVLTRDKVETIARRKEILEICNDVHYILNFPIKYENCRVFLLNLLAKALKYRAASLSAKFFIRRNLSKYEVGRLPYVDLIAKKQSVEQQCALALFNEVCQHNCYKGSRPTLLQMAEITFADEILIQIHAADDQYLTSGITAITRLLPAVFAIWIRQIEGLDRLAPQQNVMDIPDKELKHFFNIMGMMYNGTAVLYSLMARGVQDVRSKEKFMNNAKYFHALSCVCLNRRHVSYFVLKAYADYNLKYESCLLNDNYINKNIPKGSTLALSLLLNYLLVLPVLWELCVSLDKEHGPQNYENILIDHMMLPLPLNKIPGVSTEIERQLYSDVLEHLRAEVNFVEGDEMIIFLNPMVEPTLLTYTPHDFDLSVNSDVAVRKFSNFRDCRPMVWGNDDCTTSQVCPVEQYHYEDELKGKTYDQSWISRYRKLFSKVDESKQNLEENLKYQLQCMSKSLYKIISKAIREIHNLKKITPHNISVTINVEGGQHTTDISVTRALDELSRAREHLGRDWVCSLVPITRVLARVDEVFNEGRTLLMLWGRINTEL